MKRNGNGYFRKKAELKRLKRLYDETKQSFGRGAWLDSSKGRIVKLNTLMAEGHGTMKPKGE